MSKKESKKDLKAFNTNINSKLNNFENIKYNKDKKDEKLNFMYQKNFQQDLIFFKNDILKDFREIHRKLKEELSFQKDEQISTLNIYEKKIEAQAQKINYLSDLITENMKKTKMEESFEKFSTKTEQNFSKVDYKMNCMQKEIRDGLYKQEKLFNETLLYPGIIGYECRFATFHSFVDYVLSNIHQLKVYQELLKSYELHKIKGRIEKDLNFFRVQLKNNFKTLSEFTTDKVNQSVTEFKNLLDEYNTKFVDIRVENNENARQLKEHIDEVANSFGQIVDIKNEIIEKYDEQEKKIENMKLDIMNNDHKIIEQRNEFTKFDKKFDLLTTYIDRQLSQQQNMNNSNYNSMNNNNYNMEKSRNKKIIHSRRIHSASAKEYIEEIIKENFSDTEAKKINRHKKYNFKGEGFIKKYIKGKIGLGEMYKHPKDLGEEPVLMKMKIYKKSFSEKSIIKNKNSKKNNQQFFNLTTVKTIKNKKNYKNKSDEESAKLNSNTNISLSRNMNKEGHDNKANTNIYYNSKISDSKINIQSDVNKNKSYEIRKHNTNISFNKNKNVAIESIDSDKNKYLNMDSLSQDKFKNSYNDIKNVKMRNNSSQTQTVNNRKQIRIDYITRIPDIDINRISLPDKKTKNKLSLTKALSDGNFNFNYHYDNYSKQNDNYLDLFEEINKKAKQKQRSSNYNNYKSPRHYSSTRNTFNNKYIRQQLAKEKIPNFLLKKPKKQLLIIQ
jgi:hypothetical protein